MRALLVVNPVATTTSRLTSDVLVTALHGELKLEVALTTHRGHAYELGRDAAVEGYELVAVLGGDGTVNEVVNGLLHDGPHGSLPALGIVPGGSTNVLARSLGLPHDPVEAVPTSGGSPSAPGSASTPRWWPRSRSAGARARRPRPASTSGPPSPTSSARPSGATGT